MEVSEREGIAMAVVSLLTALAVRPAHVFRMEGDPPSISLIRGGVDTLGNPAVPFYLTQETPPTGYGDDKLRSCNTRASVIFADQMHKRR